MTCGTNYWIQLRRSTTQKTAICPASFHARLIVYNQILKKKKKHDMKVYPVCGTLAFCFFIRNDGYTLF